MKFKVGDKVRIKKDLETVLANERQCITKDMKDVEGTITKIVKVLHYGKTYLLENNELFWTENMLEPVEEAKCETLTEEEFDKLLEEDKKEMVDHPSHYNKTKYETIDEMVMMFGTDETATFCKLNAYKYKARAMFKHEDGGKEDLAKADWYLTKYRELKGLPIDFKEK